MKISEISIRRPITTFMAVLIIIILGSVSFSRLNVDLFPDINLPYAIVSTEYRGAGPREVESIVTKNLENVMATVNNVKSIRSVSSEGNSMIIMEFNQGTEMDFATLDIREKLDLIKRMLPEGVGTPMVLKLNPNMMPIMSFAVSQQGKDISRLKTWVEDVLKPRLERIDGVASVNISGGEEKEVKVIVDPEKLASKGLSTTQLINTLRMENINAPGGIIADGKYDLVVRTTGEFKSIDDIRNLLVASPTGSSFLMQDIAIVQEGPKDSKSYSRVNGQDSLTVSVQKESIANTAKVAEKVNREINNIQKGLKEIGIHPIVDQSVFINRSISSVTQNAVIGGLLAVIILLLFLKDIRPTLVIALSIPISVIATFIMIYFAGITLNMISLGGLALGIGMLVDNSIVVLENIFRMRQEGLSRIEAAKKGSAQVSMAIIASTLTTICVFLPIVFVQGITAEIFKQLALTVTFSLLASLVIALTLVPMLSSKFLSSEKVEKRNKTMDRIRSVYRNILNWSLLHRKSVVILTLAAFSISLLSAFSMGTEFFPSSDQGEINISIKLPRGSRYDETVKAVQQVEGLVSNIEEVDTIASSVGGSQSGMRLMRSSADSGNIDIVLKPLEKRNRSSSEVGEEIRSKVKNIAGARIQVSSESNMMGGRMGGASAAPISIEIRGDELDTLQRVSEDVRKIVEDANGTREVSTSIEVGAPELRVSLNREKAAQYGINTAMISSAVQNSLQGVVATRYKVDGRELDIRVQDTSDGSFDVMGIENMLISSPLGVSVPLKTISTLEYDNGFVKVDRKNQTRYVTVNSNIQGRSVGQVVKDIEKQLQNYVMPEGYSLYIGGENEQITDSFRDLALALLLGVILVYMVMASQFESLFNPFIIMFTVPLAFTGAFLGMLAWGIPLSVPAFLGMIILAGIVVNNGIVLVDYINTLRKDGIDRKEAILKAGPTRLQPILMTTLTTVLGLVPLALGIGEGSELELPLAVSVIGGLTFSTILTLIVVPVMYTLFDDAGRKLKRKPAVNI